MQGNDQANWARRVADLLEKTVENGATAGEERSAVQLAYQLTRQHGLDIDNFKLALGRIGAPPRYLLTADGFLLPATALRALPWDGVERRHRRWDGSERRRSRDGGGAGAAPAASTVECPASPSGQHRMTPVMQGTFRTGYESCVHCGTRRQQQ